MLFDSDILVVKCLYSSSLLFVDSLSSNIDSINSKFGSFGVGYLRVKTMQECDIDSKRNRVIFLVINDSRSL